MERVAGSDEEASNTEGASESALVQDLLEVCSLTGQPRGEDSLLYAVPMVAPYDALSKVKFKVKVTPGGQKKGKASRQAVELLCRSSLCSPKCVSSLSMCPSLALSEMPLR